MTYYLQNAARRYTRRRSIIFDVGRVLVLNMHINNWCVTYLQNECSYSHRTRRRRRRRKD